MGKKKVEWEGGRERGADKRDGRNEMGGGEREREEEGGCKIFENFKQNPFTSPLMCFIDKYKSWFS